MDLQRYIQEQLSAGRSFKYIRRELLKAGHSEQSIKDSFSQAFRRNPTHKKPEPHYEMILIVLGIVAALGVLGTTMYTFTQAPEKQIKESTIAKLTICGDGKCEDEEVCCMDCGCKGGLECINNVCKRPDECATDKECDDANPRTVDQCLGSPRKCKHTTLSECKTGDGFCAPGCTFEQDNECTPPEEKPTRNCTSILVNGPSYEKLDIVFVMDASYKYLPDPLKTFEKDVELHLTQKGLGLIHLYPWNAYKHKLNIYRVDELSTKIRCGETEECSHPAYELAKQCPLDKVVVLVRAGDSGYSPDMRTAVSYSCDGTEQKYLTGTKMQGWKCPAATNNPLITAHELSHTLGLWDVYPLLRDDNRASTKPNCDTAGCPSWCTMWDLTNYNKAKEHCSTAKRKETCERTLYQNPEDERETLYECGWTSGKCKPTVGHENVCRGAIKGVGCYLNCGSISAWRPVKDGSLMGAEIPGRVERSLEYDPISLTAIEKVFQEANWPKNVETPGTYD